MPHILKCSLILMVILTSLMQQFMYRRPCIVIFVKIFLLLIVLIKCIPSFLYYLPWVHCNFKKGVRKWLKKNNLNNFAWVWRHQFERSIQSCFTTTQLCIFILICYVSAFSGEFWYWRHNYRYKCRCWYLVVNFGTYNNKDKFDVF